MPNWDDQGKQYAAFIEAQLVAEHDRRNSVNSRAATVLTGAAGLVTLVLAVFAVIIGKDFTLSGAARNWLLFSLMMLLLAAVAAVLAGYPWRNRVVSPDTLQTFLEDPRWGDSEVLARNLTSRANVEALRKLRSGTSIKFWILLIAMTFQVLAVLGLAATTFCGITSPLADQRPPQQKTGTNCCCQCPSTTSTTSPPSPTTALPTVKGK